MNLISKATSRAFLGPVLALVVGTQPVLASTAESRFWESRQTALASPAPRPAMLPAPIPAGISSALTSSPGRSLGANLADGPSPLILIEDVHLNAEAQANIAETVRRLTSTGKVRFVALEGASGDVDLSIRRRAGNPDALRHATDYLLQAGRISGAVHALLNRTGEDMRVRGVEDDELYRANADALRRGRALRPETDRALDAVASALDRAEESDLNPSLLALVRDLRRHGPATSGSSDAIAFLNDRARKERIPVPGVLARFAEAGSLEKNFDADRVESERRDLIATLIPKLSEAEKNGLVARAVEFRAGRASQSDLFGEIRDLARRHNLVIEKWPAMAQHLRYLDLVAAIDAAAVSREARSLEDRVQAAMTTNAREQDLLAARRWLNAARALVQLSLGSGDWTAYREMNRAHVAATIPATPLPDLSAYEDFYRLAARRDAVISAEIERLMSSEEGPGILVAGAFHAEGLEKRLAASGRRLIRFTPRLTRVSDDRDAYFSAFAREKTPLESLFAGERVFLATRPAQLGLLPELLVLEQEAADPDHALANPTALLAALHGVSMPHFVTSRDVEPGVAELSSASGDIRAEVRDGEFRNVTLTAPHPSPLRRWWMRARFAALRGLRLAGILDRRRIPQEVHNGALVARREAGQIGNPFPSVDFGLTLIPDENADPAAIPTLDDIYGPLLEASQAWAESNAPTAYSMDLRRTIDMRRRVITFSGVAKNKANPVAVFSTEAAALQKYFPGYRVDVGSVQGIGAAKGLLRNYENVFARRYSFIPGPIEEENDPFISLQEAVADAVRGRWPKSALDPDFELGPFHYSVTATVPARQRATTPIERPGLINRLIWAPDNEFLVTFHPTKLLASHRGTRRQQISRAIGVAAIWVAMLATPAIVAAFMPDAALRYFALSVGYGMIATLSLLARIDSGIRIPIAIKIVLAPVYVPNVLVHAFYNLVIWFAPLTALERWVPGRARAADDVIDRLVAEINAASGPEGGHRAAADRLMKMVSLLDALGVLPRRGEGTVVNFLDGANRLIGLDRDTLGIDARRTSSMEASLALSTLFHIDNERSRLEGYRTLQADIEHTFIIEQALAGMPQPFVFYLHHVHYFFSWYKRGVQTTRISGMELASILSDHIQKLKPPVIVTTEWTDLHYGEFYDQFLARLGYRKFLGALLPGSRLEKGVEPAAVDPRMHDVNPGFNLPLGGQTEVYLHESVVPNTPRRPESEQERIDRELTGLKGVFYYPAGGSDWKPFRDLLPRMPGVTQVISIDREYGNFHPDQPHYKEIRARYLLEHEGFQVEPMANLSPTRVYVRNATGQQWSATYLQGDVLSRDVRDNLPLNDAGGRSKVAFLHVERPGEYASLTRGEYGPVFHARTISVVMPGGILGGYLRPAEEPLEFMQNHYELLGLERLGRDSNGHLFLKKNAIVDEPAIQNVIRLDQKLLELWKRVEYPRVAFWTNLTQGELETALAGLRAVSPVVHDEILAKFVGAFRKMNDFHPGSWKFSGERLVGPIDGGGSSSTTAPVRLVLPAFLIAISMAVGESAPLLFALALGAATIELAIAMPGNPVVRVFTLLLPARRSTPASKETDLDRRARILVAAARALSKPGAVISNSLIEATLAGAARAEGLRNTGRSGTLDPSDWTASLSDRNFSSAIDRAVARARAGGLDPQSTGAIVERLSGWGVTVDAGALGAATILIPAREPDDLRRVQEFERRFPASPILILANAGMAGATRAQNLSKWPVSVYGDDLFVDGRLQLRNLRDNLPTDLRSDPRNLVFALPAGFSIDDTGLAAGSEWRSLRILIIDEILGAMRVMTAEQRSILDRIVDHLVAARQA